MYHLWERSDGHIGATQNSGNGPSDYVNGKGIAVTFKVFARFAQWNQKEVEARITAWNSNKTLAPIAQ